MTGLGKKECPVGPALNMGGGKLWWVGYLVVSVLIPDWLSRNLEFCDFI